MSVDSCIPVRSESNAELWISIQVRQAFSMKRKMLRNCLQACYSVSQIDTAMSAARLDAQVRPQQLSLDDYILLYRGLSAYME